MRARTLAVSLLSSATVLVIGWQIGAQTQLSHAAPASVSAIGPVPPAPTPQSGATSPPTPPPSSGASSGPTSPSATAPSTAAPAAGVSGTFTGTPASTQFGNVQVQIVVNGGKITDVVALQLTDADSRSVSISNRAAPILRQQVLAAQSARVQGVSGATYTSEGYLTSLQSALDQAKL
ncbi:FMN-binding protein [Microbacterium sp. CJ88]|uniref:FMN-binding protein n=1 Tax=Microbacterium sp. CJ88 TaxID=3445672 RepID=UPI003F655875